MGLTIDDLYFLIFGVALVILFVHGYKTGLTR